MIEFRRVGELRHSSSFCSLSRTLLFRTLLTGLLLLLMSPLNPLLSGDQQLDEALRSRNTASIIARFRSLFEESEVEAAKWIPAAVSAVEIAGDNKYYLLDRYRVFKSAISVLSRTKSTRAIETLKKQLEESRQWQARVLALHAGIQNAGVDGVDWALTGLRDDAPAVAIVAARALGHSKEKLVIEPLIDAMEKWERAGTREKASRRGRKEVSKDGEGRVWLACRDALDRLTGESLHSAQAYRGFYQAHRDKIEPGKPNLIERPEPKTGLGLFGLELTGKNIAFVLDISGSMRASDPLTPEQLERLKRSTGVGDKTSKLEEKLMEDRRRIVRAKKEVRTVVRGLGEDRRFNVIAYSSDVSCWSEMMVVADKKNRGRALRFVEELKAEGVTVTDDALREAFSDPKVDTIYLITDGAPTHLGLRGPGLPPDSRELMERILLETKAVNHLRGVRIFTLGFEGAEEGFLEKLSEENGGRYVRIE